ncbi:MAG: pentapeptide repeat-containing protein [Phycisphaerae bacterium]|nr:pentapeptide repeat-containing protein [Phycisphaerae bacterium]
MHTRKLLMRLPWSYAALTLCGCDAWPLVAVTGAGADTQRPRNTFSEHEFAADPEMAAQLDQIVHLHLEPGGAHDGDTAGEGVDEVTYQLFKPTTLSVGVPLAENHGHWLELCDSAGNPIAFARGDHAGSAIELPPGRYKIRVHHAGAAEAATMFLRTTRHELHDERAQRREWNPGGPGDAFSLNCLGGALNDAPATAGPSGFTIWLTGDLSCATIVGLNHDQTVPVPITIRLQDQTHDARFERCNLTNGRISGRGTNIQFENCGLANVTWESCTLSGASLLRLCTLTQGTISGAKRDLSGATIDNCAMNTTFLTGCILNGTTIRWSSFGAITPNAVNLANTTIEYCSFNNVSLRDADLTTTTIQNSFFNGADFDGANLSGNSAMFRPAAGNQFAGARFAGAKLRNVDLTPFAMDSITTDWSRVDFSGADLTGKTLTPLQLDAAIFAGTILERVICRGNATAFVGADLRGARMAGADFSGCNFSRAILDRASAAASKFPDCNFNECSAHGASFEFSDLSRATFAAAQLGSAEGSGIPAASFASAFMPNAQFTSSADCRSVSFAGAHLYGPQASVASAELTLARFDGAIISGLDFTGATLTSSSFVGAQAVATSFINANLDRASFNAAYIMGANFGGASTNSTDFTNAGVSTAPCSATADCSRCSATPCTFKTLDPSRLCCFSYSERDGAVLSLPFGATIMPTGSSMFCPNGELGPCTGDKLIPREQGPFPPLPVCVPSPTTFCPPPTPAG